MGKLVYVTGGARSGKSTFAENICRNIGEDIVYVATAIAFDDEMKERIKKHQAQRPNNWKTIETYKKIVNELIPSEGILLDCITVMICNVMMDVLDDWDNISIEKSNELEEVVLKEIDSLIEYTKNNMVTMVVVTNEIGMGIVPEYPSSRLYRDVVGRANQRLAKASDEAYFLVSGIPMKIK